MHGQIRAIQLSLQGQFTKDKLSKHIAGQYVVKSGQYSSLQSKPTKMDKPLKTQDRTSISKEMQDCYNKIYVVTYWHKIHSFK